MSEQSYQQNVKRGVTGPNTGTCYLAAFDRFSVRHGVSTDTYRRYEQFASGHEDTSSSLFVDYLDFEDISRNFRRELGVKVPRNIVMTRVDTRGELEKALIKLSRGGFRIAVDLDINGYCHAVGVQRLEGDQYQVKSTWSPFPENEAVSVRKLYEWLRHAPRTRYRSSSNKTYVVKNVTALPPEKK